MLFTRSVGSLETGSDGGGVGRSAGVLVAGVVVAGVGMVVDGVESSPPQ